MRLYEGKFGVESPAEQTPAATLHEPPEGATATETYLAVPFEEKDQAKGLGAKWDGKAKLWYAPEGVDLAQSGLDRWRADGPDVVPPRSAEEQFAAALREAGLQLDRLPVMDGKIQRVPVAGDKGGEKSGAYAGHLDGWKPGGFIQNHKTGEKINWKPEGKVAAISEAERARLDAEAAQRRAQREAETTAKQEATAEAAQALWNEAPAATADNPYCKAKGIGHPTGLRVVPEQVSPAAAAKGIKIAQTVQEAQALRKDPNNRVFKAGDLLVPMKDGEGKLWSLQAANPRFKSFMKGGRKHGLHAIAIGAGDTGDIAKQMIVAEGYATADSVARAAGQPVVVAFDSGNLGAVTASLREKFPKHSLLIAADNDHTKPALGQPNVGLEKAQEAAKRHGAAVLAPQFEPGEKGSDWNDYAAKHGPEATRQHFKEQMTTAKAEAARLVPKAKDQPEPKQGKGHQQAPRINDLLAAGKQQAPTPGTPGSKPPRSPKPRLRGADLGR